MNAAVAWLKRIHLPGTRGMRIWVAVLAMSPAACISFFALAMTQNGRVAASTLNDALVWLVVALLSVIPAAIQRAMDNNQRKIAVEQKLDVVLDGVDQVREMLTEKKGARRWQPEVIEGGRK